MNHSIVLKECNADSVLSLLLSWLGVHPALERGITNPRVAHDDWISVIRRMVSISNIHVDTSLLTRHVISSVVIRISVAHVDGGLLLVWGVFHVYCKRTLVLARQKCTGLLL